MKKYLVIDIGRTYLKYGVVDETRVLKNSHEEILADEESLQDVLKYLISSCLETEKISGVYLSVLEILKEKEKWAEILSRLEDVFSVPCVMASSLSCMALFEREAGCAKNISRFLYVNIGLQTTDFIVQHNDRQERLAEVLITDGAFSNLSSTEYLLKMASSTKADRHCFKTLHRVFEKATEGNHACIDAIERWSGYLAEGIAKICLVQHLEKVVLRGISLEHEAILKPKVEGALSHFVANEFAKKIQIIFSQNQQTAGLLGVYYYFCEKSV